MWSPAFNFALYRARCLAYKKVSHTPRAPIPNRNTKFCMQSHASLQVELFCNAS